LAVTRQDFEKAVAAYWEVKKAQEETSSLNGRVGAGTAGKVRGGAHFDPIAELLTKFFLDADYPSSAIRVTAGDHLELPGYYRPQKRWDVVISYENTLVAAFELKGLGSPSFGNNYNNRVEEALGSAVDVRRARLAELFPGERPWLGYFFIMEDALKSQKGVDIETRTSFPVEDIWLADCCLAAGGKPCNPKRSKLHGKSYQDRFAIFCERLMEKEMYDAVCYITSSPTEQGPREPSAQLDWAHFSAAITGRITYLRELGMPKPTSQQPLFPDPA